MSKKEEQEITPEEAVKPEKKSKKAKKEGEELETVKADLAAEKDRYLRLFAEFENYKRRTTKERVELFKTAGQEVMVALLPVLDDFDRALKEIERSGDDGLFQGVELISNKLKETLRAQGLKATDDEVGTTFDAEIHEAVTQIPAPSDEMKGKVIDVIEKGYTLGEKIIRFPKVVIGQ
ncbi:nucleotide exchange factor GrpE [Aureitalea marina]|uniref:Protein GrpE n=1 Tax=Aureitalea marina TaxID=930804 RepID=A0A2S7KMK1_9FLAO|nr:nucleotide exchange factor GrpE [Aureitalea marina]PQB03831.1 nucleotide exchange factor GrpE [Aureitalea marina]